MSRKKRNPKKKPEFPVSPFHRYKNIADETITLQIFDLVEENAEISEGKITLQTGLAAGLVHSFMRRILEKGWVRVRQVTPRRWLYFMTPEGFSEKGRLVMNYLARTMESYRLAQAVVSAHLEKCERNEWRRLVVAGENELADIAVLHIRAAKSFELVVVITGEVANPFPGDVKVTRHDEVRNLEFDRLWVCDSAAEKWVRENGGDFNPQQVDYINHLMMAHYSPKMASNLGKDGNS